MSTTPLPPLPKHEAMHWETNQWGHAELTASDAYTDDQMQAYAQQARADLEAENARLREVLTDIAEESDDPGAVACASAALKGTP